jgi:hypothetical protein
MEEYYLCEFEYGYEGQFYQVVSNGQVVLYTDLNGNALTLEGAYGCRIINSNPERPVWAN